MDVGIVRGRLLPTERLVPRAPPGPLYVVAPSLSGKALWTRARRALGICSAVFAGLHAHYGFNGFVGGFEGLEFWSWDYNLSLLLGMIALVILAVLALTSFDRVVAAMGRGWKRLHRLVYLAGLLTLVHVVSVTIHVVNLKPWLIGDFVALVLLLLLEVLRLRHSPRRSSLPSRLAVLTVFLVCCGVSFWSFFLISHHRH
jgi:DMSO/TMAO reductase YedYZ heme-binding membrane subunit